MVDQVVDKPLTLQEQSQYLLEPEVKTISSSSAFHSPSTDKT